MMSVSAWQMGTLYAPINRTSNSQYGSWTGSTNYKPLPPSGSRRSAPAGTTQRRLGSALGTSSINQTSGYPSSYSAVGVNGAQSYASDSSISQPRGKENWTTNQSPDKFEPENKSATSSSYYSNRFAETIGAPSQSVGNSSATFGNSTLVSKGDVAVGAYAQLSRGLQQYGDDRNASTNNMGPNTGQFSQGNSRVFTLARSNTQPNLGISSAVRYGSTASRATSDLHSSRHIRFGLRGSHVPDMTRGDSTYSSPREPFTKTEYSDIQGLSKPSGPLNGLSSGSLSQEAAQHAQKSELDVMRFRPPAKDENLGNSYSGGSHLATPFRPTAYNVQREKSTVLGEDQSQNISLRAEVHQSTTDARNGLDTPENDPSTLLPSKYHYQTNATNVPWKRSSVPYFRGADSDFDIGSSAIASPTVLSPRLVPQLISASSVGSGKSILKKTSSYSAGDFGTEDSSFGRSDIPVYCRRPSLGPRAATLHQLPPLASLDVSGTLRKSRASSSKRVAFNLAMNQVRALPAE